MNNDWYNKSGVHSILEMSPLKEMCLTPLGENISPPKGTFEDEFPFPMVGYVSSLEGNYIFIWTMIESISCTKDIQWNIKAPDCKNQLDPWLMVLMVCTTMVPPLEVSFKRKDSLSASSVPRPQTARSFGPRSWRFGKLRTHSWRRVCFSVWCDTYSGDILYA